MPEDWRPELETLAIELEFPLNTAAAIERRFREVPNPLERNQPPSIAFPQLVQFGFLQEGETDESRAKYGITKDSAPRWRINAPSSSANE
jgi:hypothetical protein